MSSEIIRPNGRKLFIITVATIALSILFVILSRTFFAGEQQLVDTTDDDVTEETTETEEENVLPPPDEDITITLSAVGDIILQDAQLNSMFDNETSSYNFDPFFTEVSSILSESDVTVGSLYAVLAGAENIHAGYPSYNAPDEIADALKNANFDAVSLANFASLNFGSEGIERTLGVLEESELEAVGLYDSDDDDHAVYLEVDGIRIALIGYSENIAGYNSDSMTFDEASSIVGIMNEEHILADLEKVRENNPDIIMAMMHWGEEYQYDVTDMQNDYTELLVENGVDIIVGGYTHNIQRAGWVEHGGNDAFVAYSLGNFISNQRSETLGEGYEPTEDGVIMQFEITKAAGTGDTSVTAVDYIPTWTYRDSENNQVPFDYRILPIDDAIASGDYGETINERMRSSKERTEARLSLDNGSVDVEEVEVDSDYEEADEVDETEEEQIEDTEDMDDLETENNDE